MSGADRAHSASTSRCQLRCPSDADNKQSEHSGHIGDGIGPRVAGRCTSEPMPGLRLVAGREQSCFALGL